MTPTKYTAIENGVSRSITVQPGQNHGAAWRWVLGR